MSRFAVLMACLGAAGVAATTGLLAEWHVILFGYRAWIVFFVASQAGLGILSTTTLYTSVKRCGHREGRQAGSDDAYNEIYDLAVSLHKK